MPHENSIFLGENDHTVYHCEREGLERSSICDHLRRARALGVIQSAHLLGEQNFISSEYGFNPLAS